MAELAKGWSRKQALHYKKEKRMESFTEAYKEACKLELKYKHLFHACKSLLLPWPNREQDGRTIKKEHKKEAELGEDESQQLHNDDAKPHKDDVSKANELADLQALDNILCRAQQIRQGDKRKNSKRTTTTSIAMAMVAYGQSKPVKTKTVRTSKAISSSAKVSERSLPKKPDTAASMTRLHPPCGEASSHTTSDHTHTQDDGSGFSLQLNGQRLSMASKYCKLKHFLTRVNERQLQQAATPSTHSAGAKHFAQRLLPQVLYASVPQAQESVGQAVAIEMLLAVEEYAVIKEELLTISPKEWAVCDKQQWQDLLRVKTKLDSILTRVETLSKNTFIPTVSETCLHKASKSSENRLSNEGCCEQLGYVELQKLKQLCMLEQQLLLDNWEMEVVEFIGETVLPLLECEQHRVSIELLECIHELLGAETVTYVFVDH